MVLASSARAGAELFVVQLAKKLMAEGTEVAVVLLQPGEVGGLLRDARIRVCQLDMKSMFSVGELLPLIRFFVRERFDVIHAHGGRAVAYAAGGAVFCRTSARVATVHQLDRRQRCALGSEIIENALYRHAFHRIIGVSDACCRDVVVRRGVPNHKVARIYNGVEESGGQWRVRTGRAIGALGRLNPAKGFDRLIRAFHLLAAKDPACRLVLGGEGPARRDLEKLRDDGCGRERIELLGLVTDTQEFFQRIDVLAIPSRSESFGLVAVEAMVQGVPVIAMAIDGLVEVLGQGEYGELVGGEQPQDLADALGALLADRERREQLARRGLKRAKDFAIGQCAAQYLEQYRLVCGDRG